MDKKEKPYCPFCKKHVHTIYQKGKCRECLLTEFKKLVPVIDEFNKLRKF
jgi:hypothetical protein